MFKKTTAFLSLLFFTSCSGGIYNSIPKVDSNSEDYFKLVDNISTSPRYLDGENLRIVYQENYNDQDGQLEYKIYDQKRVVIQSNSTQSIAVKYGINKITIPLYNIYSGIYVLEIINEKGVKKYMTFLKST